MGIPREENPYNKLSILERSLLSDEEKTQNDNWENIKYKI